VLKDVTGPVGFSPDGKQIAFLRIEPASWEALLLVANANGDGLRCIARRKRPRYFSPWGLAWLPDGKSVVCFGGDAADYDDRAFRIVKVRVSDGQEQVITSRSWAWPGSISSSADAKSLIVTAGEHAEDAQQIWRVSLSDGQVSRVTNDLSDYVQVSSSHDTKVLAAVQINQSADLWESPSTDPGLAAAPVTTGGIPGLRDLNWTPTNQIVYSARAGDFLATFLLEKGHAAKQLDTEQRNETEIAATPDGRFLLYQGRGKIWRMDQDGTNPIQLTFGAHDVHPDPSPDGQSVVYASFVNWSPSIGGEPTLWSVPLRGGRPKQLTTISTSLPRYSPDGKWIAATYFPGIDPRFSEKQIVVFHADGGRPVKIFAGLPMSDSVVRWAPDSGALDFVVTKDGVGNIWRQPINGGTRVQITHFASELLFDFAWSSNGEQLATARGKSLSDVILVYNSRH
jgi:Tol biopolymer transport system component